MKDSGIGTPATRASIIERLVDVGYIERTGGRSWPPEKGSGDPAPWASTGALAELTGSWERRLG